MWRAQSSHIARFILLLRFCCNLERIEYVLDGHIHILSKVYDDVKLSLSMVRPSGCHHPESYTSPFSPCFFFFFGERKKESRGTINTTRPPLKTLRNNQRKPINVVMMMVVIEKRIRLAIFHRVVGL